MKSWRFSLVDQSSGPLLRSPVTASEVQQGVGSWRKKSWPASSFHPLDEGTSGCVLLKLAEKPRHREVNTLPGTRVWWTWKLSGALHITSVRQRLPIVHWHSNWTLTPKEKLRLANSSPGLNQLRRDPLWPCMWLVTSAL